MSAFYLGLALLLGTLLVRGASGCTTTVTGATWEFEWESDEEIPGIQTVEKCSNLCKEDVLCRGYTWKFNDIVGYCYKFKNLNGIHACDGCSSGTMPESLVGACAGSVDDILAQDTAENVEECSQFCYDTEGCNAFTWYDETTPFSKACFLYADCDTQVPCSGCNTGKISCISAPQCYEHYILSEDSRRNTFSNPDGFEALGDKEGQSYTSPMWRGPGFYRFVEPAGTQMPETFPGDYHCGTMAAGRLNGKHPTELGIEVEMEACFDWESVTCRYEHSITVTQCNGFHVYYLENTTGYLRYCGSDQNECCTSD